MRIFIIFAFVCFGLTAAAPNDNIDVSTIPLACRQEMDTGPCRAAIPNFYYDIPSKSCKPFNYGGCAGTANRFTELKDCEETCKPGRCSEVMCLMYCDEYKVDENGCKLCACKTEDPSSSPSSPSSLSPLFPHECPMIECPDAPVCPHGFLKDKDGCMTCQCKSQPSCSNEMCAMFCEFGFEEDELGCPICSCASNPCLDKRCKENEICKSATRDGIGIAVCEIRKDWCSPVQCMMYCVDGFLTDQYGCEICKCRQTDKPQCPTEEQNTVQCGISNHCLFGFAYDEHGCLTCNCLADRCLDLECQSEGQVCEAQIHSGCKRCQSTPRCVDAERVRRVLVTLKYQPLTVTDFSANDFQSLVIQSISQLLNISQQSITGCKVSSDSLGSVNVYFYLVVEGSNLVYLFNNLKAKITDDGTASITYQGTQFALDPMSVKAVYYTNYESDYDDDIQGVYNEESYEMVFIIIAVAIGLVMLLVIFCIICVACRRNSPSYERNAKIYRPLSGSRYA